MSELIKNTNRYLKVFSKTYVKSVLGDSVENHRTLTVKQVIRFMTSVSADDNVRREGRKLENVYNIFQENRLFNKLRQRNNRQDAVDINELFRVYDKYVDNKPLLKQQISKTINKIG